MSYHEVAADWDDTNQNRKVHDIVRKKVLLKKCMFTLFMKLIGTNILFHIAVVTPKNVCCLETCIVADNERSSLGNGWKGCTRSTSE